MFTKYLFGVFVGNFSAVDHQILCIHRNSVQCALLLHTYKRVTSLHRFSEHGYTLNAPHLVGFLFFFSIYLVDPAVYKPLAFKYRVTRISISWLVFGLLAVEGDALNPKINGSYQIPNLDTMVSPNPMN